MCPEVPNDPTSSKTAEYYQALYNGPSAAAPKFGTWHRTSSGTPNWPLTDNRPISWDDDLPEDPFDPIHPPPAHDGPEVAGLRLPACEDQDWDLTVDNSVLPVLHETNWPAHPPYAAFRGMTIVTDMEDSTSGTCGPHESVALSGAGPDLRCMPTDATTGTPAISADDAHVFEAYVAAFCKMGEP
jgi:hypothetical protein